MTYFRENEKKILIFKKEYFVQMKKNLNLSKIVSKIQQTVGNAFTLRCSEKWKLNSNEHYLNMVRQMYV